MTSQHAISALVGCCGFPVARRKYFRSFRVVEVQQTFYEPPGADTLARWREEAGPDFEFTLKAWQLITHEVSSPTYRRLRTTLTDAQRRQTGGFRWTVPVRKAWDATRNAAGALRADKVVFQCPASFKPTEENKERMRRFFSTIERDGLTCLWEPRGDWRPEEVAALCKELSLIHCVDPFKSQALTPGLRYYRLHGVTGYDYEYSEDELCHLATLRSREAATYFMFNNTNMLNDALRFLALLEQQLQKKGDNR